jgi:hypothetical protein
MSQHETLTTVVKQSGDCGEVASMAQKCIKRSTEETAEGLRVKLDTLSVAHWDANIGSAVVTVAKGKWWTTMGRMEDRRTLLWPEEALYMLERGRLQLDMGHGVAASVQQARELMLTHDYDWHHYAVYSDLSDQGYKVIRHRAVDVDGVTCVGQVIRPALPEPEADPKLAEGPLEALWSGETKPLVQPREALSFGCIYDRISSPTASASNSGSASSALAPAFDVYAPGTTFRKSSPRKPNYRIAVLDADEPVPPQASINTASVSDGVPLLLAVVSAPDVVSFFMLAEVDLPRDITMG